jgi:hypothetical protein
VGCGLWVVGCDFHFEQIVGGAFGSAIWVVWRCFVTCKGEGEGRTGGNWSLIRPSSVLMGSAGMRGFPHGIYQAHSLQKRLIQ